METRRDLLFATIMSSDPGMVFHCLARQCSWLQGKKGEVADSSILDYLNELFHAKARREGIKPVESGVRGGGDRRATRDDRDGL